MTDNLVTLRSGTGFSFAFVHPSSGLVTAFRRLVPHLAGPGAAFALENPEPARPPCSLAELAASYWSQLAGVATGPLVCCGWSFGGAVALELAGAAEAAGARVAAVVLIDAATPHLLRAARPDPLDELSGLFEIGAAELPAGPPPTSHEQALEVIVAALRTARGMTEIDTADLMPFVETYLWHLAVMRRPWIPTVPGAPLFLVRARDERRWSDAPADLGWSATVGTAPTMLWTPGTHYDLMSDEHAPHLAELLSGLLARLDEPSLLTDGAPT